jgi:hypothetical protein
MPTEIGTTLFPLAFKNADKQVGVAPDELPLLVVLPFEFSTFTGLVAAT